jgi:hypothetical protein
VDQHGFPSAKPIVIETESFTWNGTKAPIRLFTVSYPLSRLTTVILGVIKSLQGQPILLEFYRIRIINSLKKINLNFKCNLQVQLARPQYRAMQKACVDDQLQPFLVACLESARMVPSPEKNQKRLI